MSALLPLCQETLQVWVPVEQDAAATAAEPGQNSARSHVRVFGGSHLCLDHLLQLQGSMSAGPAGGVCPAHARMMTGSPSHDEHEVQFTDNKQMPQTLDCLGKAACDHVHFDTALLISTCA